MEYRNTSVSKMVFEPSKWEVFYSKVGNSIPIWFDWEGCFILLAIYLPITRWVSSRSYWAMYFHVNRAPFFRQNIAPSVRWNVTIFPQVLVLEISRFFSFGSGSFFINFQQTKSWPEKGGSWLGEKIFALVFEFCSWYLRRYDTLNRLWETPEPFWLCLLLDM